MQEIILYLNLVKLSYDILYIFIKNLFTKFFLNKKIKNNKFVTKKNVFQTYIKF